MSRTGKHWYVDLGRQRSKKLTSQLETLHSCCSLTSTLTCLVIIGTMFWNRLLKSHLLPLRVNSHFPHTKNKHAAGATLLSFALTVQQLGTDWANPSQPLHPDKNKNQSKYVTMCEQVFGKFYRRLYCPVS